MGTVTMALGQQHRIYHSGKRSKRGKGFVRRMKRNGEFMEWASVEKYYQKFKGDTVRKVYKLNEEDVYLTSYSVMRVSLLSLQRNLAPRVV